MTLVKDIPVLLCISFVLFCHSKRKWNKSKLQIKKNGDPNNPIENRERQRQRR